MTRFPPGLVLSPGTTLWCLLLANGFLIALMLALSKTATAQGMPPITYAFWQTLIAGLLLLGRSHSLRPMVHKPLVIYFLISGLTGIAIPNVIAFYLVNRLGTGFTGIMYALPPIFTFVMSIGIGLEKNNWRRLTGLTIAVLACAWIIIQRHSGMSESPVYWYALGLLIPIALSIGNVYRSVAWPANTSPMTLAAGTLLTCAVILGVFAKSAQTPLLSADFDRDLWKVVVLQGGATALAYLCAFEIQKRATPVFFSQLGSVAAIFGLIIGVVWFREDYAATIWLGVLVVFAGLRLANKAPIRAEADTDSLSRPNPAEKGRQSSHS